MNRRLERWSVVASETLTPNSYGRWALPFRSFDLGRVQRIDLFSALMLALLAHPAGKHQRMGEDALQLSLALDLAHDVARDLAEIGSDCLERRLARLNCLACA